MATLFVLLIVSSAIVMRSFFIRRRFRREIEHALAAGNIIIPPTAGAGTRRRPLGEKPKLWDTSVKSATAVKWSYITVSCLSPFFPLNFLASLPSVFHVSLLLDSNTPHLPCTCAPHHTQLRFRSLLPSVPMPCHTRHSVLRLLT